MVWSRIFTRASDSHQASRSQTASPITSTVPPDRRYNRRPGYGFAPELIRMSPDHNQTLKETVATVLGISPESIGDETSMDTVPEWTSLKHLNLVLAIEEQFGVSLSEEESFEILSYPLIKADLTQHGIGFTS